MKRVFIDMDGVMADFEGFMAEFSVDAEYIKRQPGCYRRLRPIPGAIEAIRQIIAMGYEVWVATKPPTAQPHAYAEKVAWILEHLPELERRIIITHDKGLLGDECDFLCDDMPQRANCAVFPGTLIHFGKGMGWPQVVDYLRCAARVPRQRVEPSLRKHITLLRRALADAVYRPMGVQPKSAEGLLDEEDLYRARTRSRQPNWGEPSEGHPA